MKTNKSFWVRNISKNAISINDLGLHLMPFQFANLLNNKAYPYLTPEIIKSSLNGGALGKFKDRIIICKVAPPNPDKLKTSPPIDVDLLSTPPTKIRSLLVHKEEHYEELQLSDEDYANENAELAEEDELGKYKKV